MKHYLPVYIAIFLSGCVTTPPTTTNPELTVNALAAFEDICLATAPSFATAEKTALNHGVTEFMVLGPMKMGNSNQGYNIQIQEGKECAIGFDPQKDSTITTRFLDLVQKHIKQNIAKKVPTVIQIDGQPFIVTHDRKGGETLVLLKLGS